MNRREFLLTNLIAGATVLLSKNLAFSQSNKDIETRVEELLKQLSLDERFNSCAATAIQFAGKCSFERAWNFDVG